MIHFTILKDKKGNYKGFKCKGHAGYADAGSDIVCSAVSILVINTANAIETFTDTKITANGGSDGLVEVTFTSAPGKDTILLMDTLLLGIEGISNNHSEYVDIIYKEVT